LAVAVGIEQVEAQQREKQPRYVDKRMGLIAVGEQHNEKAHHTTACQYPDAPGATSEDKKVAR
jgi:hypothetical protein